MNVDQQLTVILTCWILLSRFVNLGILQDENKISARERELLPRKSQQAFEAF
jgi:hypothetical protein